MQLIYCLIFHQKKYCLILTCIARTRLLVELETCEFRFGMGITFVSTTDYLLLRKAELMVFYSYKNHDHLWNWNNHSNPKFSVHCKCKYSGTLGHSCSNMCGCKQTLKSCILYFKPKLKFCIQLTQTFSRSLRLILIRPCLVPHSFSCSTFSPGQGEELGEWNQGTTVIGLSARFGASLPRTINEARRTFAVLTNPLDCCSNSTSKFTNSIALATRGEFAFTAKAETAQAAGAAGLLL